MTGTLSIRLDDEQLATLASLVADRLAAQLTDAGHRETVPRWLTTKEAAAHLRMHVSEVHRAAGAGAIPHEQDAPGCALRFRADELDEWVRAGRPGRVVRPRR